MSSVASLNPSDSKLFHDYLLPSLSTLPNDPEESVRVEYALGVVKLALVAHGLLIRLQQEANHKAVKMAKHASAEEAQQPSSTIEGQPPHPPPSAPVLEPLRYDLDLACARQSMESVIKDLLIGSRQNSADHQGEREFLRGFINPLKA